MKIVIFGGTTEGRNLAKDLADAGARVLVSVASEYGAQQQGEHPNVTVEVGNKDAGEIGAMIRGADLVVDATHPYATEVTENIRRAAADKDIGLLRLKRDEEPAAKSDADDDKSGAEGSFDPESLIRVADRRQAAELAESVCPPDKNIMLTTGVRDLAFYCERLDPKKIYARVLPSKESIETCQKLGLDPKHIIALQGPFSAELNEALMREYDTGVMITKESGRNSGYADKIKACRKCSVTAVVIERPSEEGLGYDEVLAECSRLMREVDR